MQSDIELIHYLVLSVLKDLKYADSHEWAKIEGNSATIGITDHAQDHLGDVVYVELPEVGTAVTQGSGFGAVESVKATSDINSPVSGKVVEVNQELSTSPGLVTHLSLIFVPVLHKMYTKCYGFQLSRTQNLPVLHKIAWFNACG